MPPYVEPGYVDPDFSGGSANPFRDAWTAIAPEFGEALGGVPVTLRRPSTLRARSAMGLVNSLVLAADAAAGAMLIDLRLPGSGTIGGALLSGSTLTVAGHAYSVATDAEPTGNQLLGVAISPGLAASSTAGSAVTVDPEVRFTFAGCIISAVSREDVTGDLSGELAAKIAIPVRGARTTPRMNDIIVLEDGRALRIVADPPTTGGWYDCLVGYNRGANP